MKYSGIVYCSANVYYETILLSVVTEVRESIGKEIDISDLNEGFKYRKNTKNGKVTYKIKRLIPNKQYSIFIKENNKKTEITYLIEQIDEVKSRITIIQNFSDHKKLNPLIKFIISLKMNRMIRNIDYQTKKRIVTTK